MKNEILAIINNALFEAWRDGELNNLYIETSVDTPKNPEHGDFSTAIALKIASGKAYVAIPGTFKEYITGETKIR